MKKVLVLAMLTLAFVSQAEAQRARLGREHEARAEATRTREAEAAAARAARYTTETQSPARAAVAKIQQLRAKAQTVAGGERLLALKMIKDANFARKVDALLAKRTITKGEILELQLEAVRGEADAQNTIKHGADYALARESATKLEQSVKTVPEAHAFAEAYIKARAEGLNEFMAMEKAGAATGKKVAWRRIKDLCPG